MANEEHVRTLKKGFKHWNDWRQKKPNIKPDSPVREVIALCAVILLLAATSGCATFREAGTRTVKHLEIRERPISQTLKRYHAPRTVQFPSVEDQTLVLKCEQEVDVKVSYRTPAHEERILKRKVTGFQATLEDLFSNLNDDNPSLVFWSVIGIPVWIGLAPLSLLTNGTHEETKYDPIPGSESSFVHYMHESQTVAAPGVKIELVGIETEVTDSKGLVGFSAPPTAFDQGVRIIHGGSSQTYLIRRTKHFRTREYKAPGADEAQLTSNVVGAYLTIRKVKKIAALGGGPAAIAGAVLVDIATGLAVGYVIDVAATRTEKVVYYRWSILPEK